MLSCVNVDVQVLSSKQHAGPGLQAPWQKWKGGSEAVSNQIQVRMGVPYCQPIGDMAKTTK